MWALGRLTALSPRERLLVLEALVSLLWVRFVFAALPLTYALRLMKVRAVGSATTNTRAQSACEVQLAISRAARHAPFKAACLQQAFAGFSMLRRRGLSATVHFGVKHSADRSLVAHAWSNSGNTPITGAALISEYVPIAIFYT